jgi:transcription initiation factor TFIIB
MPGDAGAHTLVRYNNRLEYSTRALKAGLREVRSLCAACELSTPTEERAAYLYREASRADLLQGRSRESIAATCVYTAARRYGQPVTLGDIAAASPVAEERISSDYRTLLRELDLGLQPPEPQEFLAKVATEAGVPYRVQRRARAVLEEIAEVGGHVGQSPSGVAAAAVYLAAQECDYSVTQATVAEAAGVSTVTVSRQTGTLCEFVE